MARQSSLIGELLAEFAFHRADVRPQFFAVSWRPGSPKYVARLKLFHWASDVELPPLNNVMILPEVRSEIFLMVSCSFSKVATFCLCTYG